MKKLNQKQVAVKIAEVEAHVDGIITSSTSLASLFDSLVNDTAGKLAIESLVINRLNKQDEYTGKRMPKIDDKDEKDIFKMKGTSPATDVYKTTLQRLAVDAEDRKWSWTLGYDGKTGAINTCNIARKDPRIASENGNSKSTSNEKTTLAELLNKAVRLYGYEDTLMGLVTIGQAIKDSATANKAAKK